MEGPYSARLPITAISPELYQQLLAIARRADRNHLDLTALVRTAVERFVAEENRPQSWITLATLERLRSLAPEMSQALGYPVATDEEVLCELLNHWQRTKTDCYGRASRPGPTQ